MGRSQKRLSFLRKLRPADKDKQSGSSETKHPEQSRQQPEQSRQQPEQSGQQQGLPSSRVDNAEVAKLLKSLDKVDLGRPVRPPRRRDKAGSGGSSSSVDSTTSKDCSSKSGSSSSKSSTSTDEVFSPTSPTKSLSPRTPPADVSGAEARLRKAATGAKPPGSSMFFKPVRVQGAQGGESDGRKDAVFPEAPLLLPSKPLSAMVKKGTNVLPSVEKMAVADSKETPKTSRARVEIKVNLLKPITPTLQSRKVCIRTTSRATDPDNKKVAVIAPRRSNSIKRAKEEAEAARNAMRPADIQKVEKCEDAETPEKPAAAAGGGAECSPEPVPSCGGVTVVMRKKTRKGSDDDEDEGICSIEDVDAEELTRTDKAVLLRKKFSQLKMKSNALKMKDAEIKERFLMLQTKRSRISSVTKRSSRSVRSSLVGV